MASVSLFDHDYKALVIGASGTIGQAFVVALLEDPRCTRVEQVSREHSPGFDLHDTDGLANLSQTCARFGPYSLIVDATGALTIDGQGPEKSLNQIRPEIIAQSLQINAIGPLMVLRHFAPLLAPGSSIYAKLSARVGSISDNRKGGWYGYRASKAALNMFLQTAAIELQRKNPQLRVVALQPGTVRSKLSNAFTSANTETLSAEVSAVGMLAAMRGLQWRVGAQFVDYKGQGVPW